MHLDYVSFLCILAFARCTVIPSILSSINPFIHPSFLPSPESEKRLLHHSLWPYRRLDHATLSISHRSPPINPNEGRVSRLGSCHAGPALSAIHSSFRRKPSPLDLFIKKASLTHYPIYQPLSRRHRMEKPIIPVKSEILFFNTALPWSAPRVIR